MADNLGKSHDAPSVVDVQQLFCCGGIQNYSATTIADPKEIYAFQGAIHAGQEAAVAAVKTARLFEFGEISLNHVTKLAAVSTSPPFGGEPAAFTFILREGDAGRTARLLLVTAPRKRLCSAFEILFTGDRPCSRWLSTAVNDQVFAESPGIAKSFDGVAWARDLAQLVAFSKLVSVPAPVDQNRSRRLRRVAPLPGYFNATLPSPAVANCKATPGGNHAPPGPHLRREHVRQLRDGRIVPVRPCAVRGGPAGVGAQLHAVIGGV